MSADTVTDKHGLIWQNGGESTDDHLAFGGHEPALIEILKFQIPEGGTFLDVGAHVGLYTLNMADKAGHVFAIEANPLTYATLMENIKVNAPNLKATIHAVNLAAWDRFEVLDMVDANGKKTGGSTRCIEADLTEKSVSLPGPNTQGLPLDDALPEGFKIDAVKIDVEGAEYRVLRGMAKTILRDHPLLFIEMHDKVYNDPQIREDVVEFLEDIGYSWNDDLKFGAAYYIVARAKEDEPEFDIEVVKSGFSESRGSEFKIISPAAAQAAVEGVEEK